MSLDDLPRVHPRRHLVAEAELDLARVFDDWVKRHKALTFIEMLTCLQRLTADLLKYALRVERHPHEPGKGGDVE